MTIDKASVLRNELSSADLAMLDQNGRAANEELDVLLALVKEHNEQHCSDWFCGTVKLRDRLLHLHEGDVHMLLRVAMQRILSLT